MGRKVFLLNQILTFDIGILQCFLPYHSQVNKWDLSFASIWNTVVWLMLMNFFVKIVTSTAQSYLKKQQEKDLAALNLKSRVATTSSDTDHHSSR